MNQQMGVGSSVWR